MNPRKSEFGKVSKQILDRINAKVIESTGMNQWKNTKSVLTWFNNIADKDQHSFIAFDVVHFYPSISIELLDAALDFALRQYYGRGTRNYYARQNIMFTQFGKLLG